MSTAPSRDGQVKKHLLSWLIKQNEMHKIEFEKHPSSEGNLVAQKKEK